MSWVFEVTDKSGRRIHLSRERWKHITVNHPDMTSELEEIREALIRPTHLIRERFDAQKWNYYKRRKRHNIYLLVVVKYINGEGFVATAFKTRKIIRR